MPTMTDQETDRVAALERYQILDTPAEQDFDDLVKLASLFCGAPIALVSLVGRERMWFKGSVGLDVKESPSQGSFCSYAIESDDLFEVPNAVEDPRFVESPLVAGPMHIRFYAGQPLITPAGYRVGTVCVLDTEERTLTDLQKQGLALLGRQAIAVMEGRLAQRTLAKSLDLLQVLNESLEARVADRTAELAERTADLELFAYAISHDLKAPLRAVSGYARLLAEEIASESPGDAGHFLDRILDSSSKMTEMLEGILAYSRIGTAKPTISSLKLGPLVSKLVDEVRSQPQSAHVPILCDIGEIEICAESEALSIALRNLLQNAVKFSAGTPSPKVIVRARTESEQCEISVRDNGIGFDMRDSKRIFDMFQRLEPSSQGTGVGLALVARAVKRLGGTIRTDATVGNGAAFMLAIPLRPLTPLPDAAS